MPTASEIIGGAFDLLNIKTPGQAVEGNDAVDGLRRLNGLVEQWSLQSLTALVTQAVTFTGVTANQGSYTIGTGAEIDTPRPASIQSAWLVLNNATPSTKIPTPLITNQSFQAITQPDLTSELWTQVFYNPTYTLASPYGTITLWPVPTTGANDLLLYIPVDVATFADLTTDYGLAPGYAMALEYNLAVLLADPYGRQVLPSVAHHAEQALSFVKRANVQRSDLTIDAALMTPMGRGVYNIFSDVS